MPIFRFNFTHIEHAGALVPRLVGRQERLDPGAPVALVQGQDDTIADAGSAIHAQECCQ
jgi:hypothetical protein